MPAPSTAGSSPNSAGSAGGGNTNGLVVCNEACGIRDVWASNLEDEFRTIIRVVQKYNYVAMDTEFPGVVARPIGEFRSTADYQYQLLRCNVDLLKIIQLGLTFLDEHGNTPPNYSTWQFNFKFSLTEDMYAQDSIDLLTNSGIQFKKHDEEGIDPYEFAQLLMTSGVVLSDNVKWLSFHSGYDFGYMLKLLTDQNLPMDESEFFELLRIYFPAIYDVKYLMKSCKNLKGGLQEVAEQLELERIGPQHQAGSDSLLTGAAFFKMREERQVQKAEWSCCCVAGAGSDVPDNAAESEDASLSVCGVDSGCVSRASTDDNINVGACKMASPDSVHLVDYDRVDAIANR
ncbi:hypothetical protein HPB50_007063 [Hyalomma asiaticum]|uniref:Uncharacterized protein n=1 Tax=Hyalomma asiaticum TaxID=266040 RepID=A0ACB7SKD4_HYAAI|nr:hypothetical protein HPB50_007063 [Hyalomma asiaticum]